MCGGDASGQWSLDDATRHLEALEQQDAHTYCGWADFAKNLLSNPLYVKLAAKYAYGGYAVVGKPDITYTTLEAAKVARDVEQNANFVRERQALSGQLYIAAVNNNGVGETITQTDVAVEGCGYMVFSPLSGEHERFNDFAAAQARLNEIEHLILTPRCAVHVGRQIVVDGVAVAVDVLEGE
jgi:hypothetical protein